MVARVYTMNERRMFAHGSRLSRDRREKWGKKRESYFWLLSRKSNLRSLTPKELQMHGRQHTGVSIYEARTARPGRKMRGAAGVTRCSVARNESEAKRRDKERDTYIYVSEKERNIRAHVYI